MKGIFLYLGIVAAFVFTANPPIFSEQLKKPIPLMPFKVESVPRIDGKLDEKIWSGPAQFDGFFVTMIPVNGLVFPKRTKVWLAYDADNLYFAFYCYDDEPNLIKTSMTKRDNISNDDWVGVALDSLANGQSMYELFVNPNGIQGDSYFTPSGGENNSPDYVWFSGASILEDGYTVEIRLPLKSIRYQNGKNVEMRIMFIRRISRLSTTGSFPQIIPGTSRLSSAVKIIYGELDKQLILEVIPSLTYNSIWNRNNPVHWDDPDDRTDFGAGVKYGITSSVFAEFTLNPDFSQVESDSFQVIQNIRYPIFYEEKRPFFMEASDLFSLAGSGLNLTTAVHTRKIVDPYWGARLTGDIGMLSFGVLAASDEWAGKESADDENFYLGKDAIYLIGRAKYALYGDSYIGFLYSGKEIGDYHNRVAAADMTLRFEGGHIIRANYIYSDTNDPETNSNYQGNSYNVIYQYSSKKFYCHLNIEKFDENFVMDTAYYQRTGVISSHLFIQPIFAINDESFGWLQSVKPIIRGHYIYDYKTDMDDVYLGTEVQLSFIKDGWFIISWDIVDDEAWEGTSYDTSGFSIDSGIQITNWLKLALAVTKDNYIYYDPVNHYLGNRFYLQLATRFQPLDALYLGIYYQYTDFNKKSTGEDIYNYHILYTKATYQPNKNLQFRAIVQYDSYLDLVLTDLLTSYELIPATVFHLGYGSLHERLGWDELSKKWLDNTEIMKFYLTKQSIFLKASYRVQF